MNAHAGHGLKLAEDPLLSDKGPTPELGTTFGQNLWQRSRSERSGAPPPSAKCGERPFSSWKFTAYAATDAAIGESNVTNPQVACSAIARSAT